MFMASKCITDNFHKKCFVNDHVTLRHFFVVKCNTRAASLQLDGSYFLIQKSSHITANFDCEYF